MASLPATATSSILLVLYVSSLFHSVTPKHWHTPTNRHHDGKAHTHASNPRLHQAYIAIQAWKKVIYSDPKNMTTDWTGPLVCRYTGIYCAPVPGDLNERTVAGIDLNFGDIAGYLPDELGLLSDLALLHLNSNRFCGILPKTLSSLTLLAELDLSNNRFVGPFPYVTLSLPSLLYLDLRFNEFEGPLPPELFNRSLDAIFVNNNWFTSLNIPPNNLGGGGVASVVVFANNKFGGCLPPGIANFAHTLEELLLINMSLSGCLPPEVGFLYKLRVLDVSSNELVGPLPYTLAGLAHLEQFNIAHNKLSGVVPEGVCGLPDLENFTVSYNFFCEEEGLCSNLSSKGIRFDDRRNCLPDKKLQRSKRECEIAVKRPVECLDYHCNQNGGRGVAPVPAPLASAPKP